VIDLKVIREEPQRVADALRARGVAFPLDELLALDSERRRFLQEAEELRALRNRVSEEIARDKRDGRGAEGDVARMRAVGERIKALDPEIQAREERIDELVLQLPNLPHPSVPRGSSAADNVELRRWGEPRRFEFPPKPHWEIGEALGILDFARGAKLAGARFAVLWGIGAQLERALITFMLDLHTKEHGYREIWSPALANSASLRGTGQLPKFAEDLFRTQDDLWLIPTAEVPVTNLHRDEILPGDQLPLKYCAYTPCFRREAGSYGADARGLIRQHQFDKVELVRFARPETSYEELERLTADAEAVLQRLELPYQVVALCAGDLGFAAAQTFDLEVWMPGQGRYREISSCSNFEAFQARRAQIRFRPKGGGKAEFVHTLNGSGLAVGRTFAALLENCQQADGSVTVPKILRPYLDGIERIEVAR
jgi:seryl-tRNA synthetase